MKVLHFKTHYLNPSETFIDRLTRNHETFEPVVATCYKKSFTDSLRIYEMPRKGINGVINTLQLKLNQSPGFLNDVIQQEKPDIIHGHFGLDSYRLISVSRKFKIPFIVNFYGHDVIRLPQEFGWKQRYKRLRKHMTWAIAGSEDMRQNLIKLGFSKERITTIKLALNTEEIQFQQRENAEPKLMMIGRIVEKKGFIYAIRAVHLLKEILPNIELSIFGDGKLLPQLKTEIKKLGLEKQIHFHGFTDNKSIVQQLYKHDILLVPSVQAEDGDREGIPQTTVEGMATGIPVIASTHAGLPELVKDKETGLLIPERDSEAIKNAVLELINTPSLVKKVSFNGRKEVEKEHNIKIQVKKTEELYKKLIHEKP